ncbi:MAG TPA: protein kinase [Isosphaeraceae bacterium]|jgi:serine/threonine protein kinase|nr:protein kinase [Isosphaeraceae bacterium]
MAMTAPDHRRRLDAALDAFDARWEGGLSPRAEDYLDGLDSEGAVELIYREYCLARSSGDRPDAADYFRRFPTRRDRLARLFELHEALGASRLADDSWGPVGPAPLPEAGDEVGPYRLVRELGRGSFARVFLAEQTDLGDRQVVVKVATRPSAEPTLLARARHAHIVEVLRQATADDGALHLVCMPYLGGATLAKVLAERRRCGPRPRSGRDLLADLDHVADPDYPHAGLPRPAREIMGRLSYDRAVAWVVARLAEALDHAHRKGVAHGDLKPSNVLLTADGHPMLFDFNLAVDWRADDGVEAGGTLAYMAPERLRAVADPARAAGPCPDDRHRADLYALGLILLEALSGTPPNVPRDRPRSPRELAALLAASRGRGDGVGRWPSRALPPSLRPILARCLAPDPDDRYGRASELAEDLDRWRADKAPRFAPETWRHAGTRWARRRRAALAVAALTIAVAATAALAAGRLLDAPRREQARAKLAALWDGAEPGVYRFRHIGRWQAEPQGDPAEVAHRLLARYDVLGTADWRRRDDVTALPEADREELEAWLLEQAWRLASALASRPDSPDDWRRALDGLDRVGRLRSVAPFEALAADLRRKLSLPDPPPRHAERAPSWMDAYLRGVAAEESNAAEALEHYRAALKARPGTFWAQYRLAAVAFRLGDFAAAARAMRGCVDRRPGSATLRTLLAGCLLPAGRPHDALEECELALDRDPDEVMGYRIRAFIHQQLGQPEASAADQRRYSLLTAFQGKATARKLTLELTRLATGSAAASDEATARALEADPVDARARYLRGRRLEAIGRVDAALAEFDRILETDPDDLDTRFARALLLVRRGGPRAGGPLDPEAARALDELIEHPRLDELLGREPLALRTFHLAARDRLLRGQVPAAIDLERRAWALANDLWITRVAAGRDMRGEANYALGRALAFAADDDEALGRAAHYFAMADATKGFSSLGLIEADPLLAPRREALRARLATTPTGR